MWFCLFTSVAPLFARRWPQSRHYAKDTNGSVVFHMILDTSCMGDSLIKVCENEILMYFGEQHSNGLIDVGSLYTDTMAIFKPSPCPTHTLKRCFSYFMELIFHGRIDHHCGKKGNVEGVRWRLMRRSTLAVPTSHPVQTSDSLVQIERCRLIAICFYKVIKWINTDAAMLYHFSIR